MDYLYHYTSLETLALILQNRTFRLNNLAAMDDLEEGSSIDLGKIGRFIYSSSWTKDAMESIPLWQLYTPDMSGVRIKMPENIFEEELISSEEMTEYIVNNTDYSAEEVKAGAISFNKGLWEIQKRHNVYFPTFKANLKQVEYNNNLILQNVIENNSIQLSKIGKYKRDVWEFQKEWRYLLLSYPLSIAEMIKFGENDPQMIINRMIDENIPNIKFIDIEINEWAFNNIEILCGPKMTDEQKQFLNDLVDKYNTNIKIEESSLKIRQG